MRFKVFNDTAGMLDVVAGREVDSSGAAKDVGMHLTRLGGRSLQDLGGSDHLTPRDSGFATSTASTFVSDVPSEERWEFLGMTNGLFSSSSVPRPHSLRASSVMSEAAAMDSALGSLLPSRT